MGGTILNIFLVIVLGLASYEIASVSDQKPHFLLTALCFAAAGGMALVTPEIFTGTLAIWLVVLFVMELVFENMSSDQVVYTFSLSVLFALALRCILKIYAQPQPFLILLYIALATFITDTGAYFFGVFFGKHKLIPRVSPNKTWEGAIGGYVSGAVISLAYGLMVLKAMPPALLICGSLVLPVISQVGDLSFSSVKRHFGIKDFGNFMPGHGGVLDRIDSLLFCLIVYNFLLSLWGIL